MFIDSVWYRKSWNGKILLKNFLGYLKGKIGIGYALFISKN